MKGNNLYLFAGGRSRDIDDTLRIIGTAYDHCGSSRPFVAYIGTASQDNRPFYFGVKRILLKAGAGDVELVRLAGKDLDIDKARYQLERADVIFISGGEVEDGIYWLDYHGLSTTLRQMNEAGKVFIGISAGTIMMGQHWIKCQREDDYTTAELFSCLNFVATVFDTHAEDEDWIELKTTLRLLGDQASGYGIPSGAAVGVDEQGHIITLNGRPIPFVNKSGVIVNK